MHAEPYPGLIWRLNQGNLILIPGMSLFHSLRGAGQITAGCVTLPSTTPPRRLICCSFKGRDRQCMCGITNPPGSRRRMQVRRPLTPVENVPGEYTHNGQRRDQGA
jgi:hypothetical protein